MAQAVKKPSWLPVIIGALAVIASSIISLTGTLRISGIWIYIAYLFSPLVPIAMLAWSRSIDNAARSNIFYDIAKSQKIVKITSLLSLASFVVAITVVWEIASRWSQQ
jgi:hypothetical protein